MWLLRVSKNYELNVTELIRLTYIDRADIYENKKSNYYWETTTRLVSFEKSL